MDIFVSTLKNMIERYKGISGVTEWIHCEKFKIFVRVTKRLIEKDITETIDISNVVVYDEYQNTGVFKEVLNVIEQLASEHNKVIYVESIQNPILVKYLEKEGFTLDGCEFCPNAFKRV